MLTPSSLRSRRASAAGREDEEETVHREGVQTLAGVDGRTQPLPAAGAFEPRRRYSNASGARQA